MIKIFIFCCILVSPSNSIESKWTKYIGGEIETIIGDPLGTTGVNYLILDTVGNGRKSVFKTEDENKVRYAIKVKRKSDQNSVNFLDHENKVLTKLKQLAQGKPLDVGIVNKFDYIKFGKISPPKENASDEITAFTCNALVETLLDTDIWDYIRSHETSAKQIFTFVYDLLGILKFIHDNGYMHNDVDPLNVGLKDGKLVLFDFELSTEVDHQNMIYVKLLPSGEKIPFGIKRVLPEEALNCGKRTVVTQLKSAVYFGFVLFGSKVKTISKDFPISSLCANYQRYVKSWRPSCNKAFKRMWAAAEKGNHEDMRKACKIVIDAEENLIKN